MARVRVRTSLHMSRASQAAATGLPSPREPVRTAPPAQVTRPHIVYFLVDDLGCAAALVGLPAPRLGRVTCVCTAICVCILCTAARGVYTLMTHLQRAQFLGRS